MTFVAGVTHAGGPAFVPPTQRVAVFDNDGTLRVERTMYNLLALVLQRIQAMAPDHPEWRDKQPFKAALDGEMKTLGESGMKGLMKFVMATHAGMTSTEFAAQASDWIATARHPDFERRYPELTLAPTLQRAGNDHELVTGGTATCNPSRDDDRRLGLPGQPSAASD